jgi:hypothetical protein
MPEQMIIWPGDEFDNLKGDKRLELLKKIDISQFIPQNVYKHYYQDTGRPPFTLEFMLLALLAQKIPNLRLFVQPWVYNCIDVLRICYRIFQYECQSFIEFAQLIPRCTNVRFH